MFFFICWENSFFLCVLFAMHICELGNSMRNVFNINTLEALGVVYNMLYVYIYICIRGCSTSGYVIYISFIQHRVVHGFAGGKFIHGKMKLVNGKKKTEKKCEKV